MSNESCNVVVEFILVDIECVRSFGDGGERGRMGEDGIQVIDRIVIG